MAIPAIGDPAQLISLAAEITCQAAGRYRLAAERSHQGGRHDLAKLFRELSAEETAQLDRIKALLGPGLAIHPVPAAWMNAIEPLLPVLDLADLIHARPYAALAEAVREKERAFRLFSFLSAQSEDPRVQSLADTLAKEQLQSAHRLRQSRRKAFHKARSDAPLWPKAREVETLDDLVTAAEVAEIEFLRLVERRVGSTPLCTAIVQATLDTLPGLEQRRTKSATVDDGGGPEPGAGSDDHPPGTVLDQALEAFAFYDAVTARASTSDVLEKAQALTAMALTRIELIRAAQP